MDLRLKSLFLAFLLLFFYIPGAYSQVPPKTRAGAVERNLEVPEAEAEKRKPEDIVIEEEQQKLEMPKGEKVKVLGFEFEGNKVLDDELLNDLVSGYINKELSLTELEQICELIAQEYHKQGYFLAKAILPAQEINKGIVKIIILEGTLGVIRIKPDEYYREDFIIAHFHPTKNGIIHHPSLIKSLLLLNENLDLVVKATLKKGEKLGTTDIIIKAEDNFPFDLSWDYNNFGSEYNAEHRMGTSAEVGNILMQGSKLSFRGVGGIDGEDLWFTKAGYQFPIANYGTKGSLSYLWSDFDVGKEYENLDAGGESKIISAEINHPIIRSRVTSLDCLVGFDYKDIENYLMGDLDSDDELSIFKAGLNFNHLDSYKGRNLLNSLLSVGVDDLWGAMGSDEPVLASRVGSGGEFVKFNLDFTRIQKIPWSSFLIFKFSGQTTPDILPVSEQFSIGGGSSVRGYPISEYLGDQGYFGSLELRTPIPFISEMNVPFTNQRKFKEFIQLTAFLDHGKTFLRNPQAGEADDNTITGAGPGLRLTVCGFNASLDWGFSVAGDEPSTAEDCIFYVRVEKKLF
ncbi:MAG: ShlB/FhaC/HecB family hemolysin secretion/activation protein [Candidatus Omnitrophica bacterium]|nr:ShlB/FhaC/HecB family hemolysin secretion/activation protein [Candidatus Omnitrophota bacterium]